MYKLCRMSKCGQIEHIFSDLIPAVIILVVVLISINVAYDKESTTNKIEKTSIENKQDGLLVNYLRTPLENKAVGFESAELFMLYLNEKELSFSDLILLTQTQDNEFYKLALRERTNDFLNELYGHWSLKINEEVYETNTKPDFVKYSYAYLPSDNGVITVGLAVWEI